jgi:transposase
MGVVWDNLPAHKSGANMPGIRSQRDWLTAERLPAYAPELNPVEYLWDARIGRQVAWRAAKSARMAW